MKNTNWLAVAAAAVAGMTIGFLWYGVLFQDEWMAGNGITLDGERMFKHGTEVPMSSMPMIMNSIAMVLYATFMAWLTAKTGHTTFSSGAVLGLIVGVVMLVGVYINNLFAGNPLSLTTVDGSYSATLFTVIGAIVGGWRKK